MQFDLSKSLEILERTPAVLESMLSGLSEEWIGQNEGGESWSPYDIVGHYIHGEKTDWIPRMDIILSGDDTKIFEPFDRFAQFSNSKDKSLSDLLAEFRNLRQANIKYLRSKNLTEEQLSWKALHPELGEVNLSELLSSWVVHDLNHIAQISRAMAYQYKAAVGPWQAYMGILNR